MFIKEIVLSNDLKTALLMGFVSSNPTKTLHRDYALFLFIFYFYNFEIRKRDPQKSQIGTTNEKKKL
jgi:hypothetical protein